MNVAPKITAARNYLVNACQSSGQFTYLVDGVRNTPLEGYSTLRHAGVISCLASYLQRNPGDTEVLAAINNATAYLLQNFVSELPASALADPGALAAWAQGASAKWSTPAYTTLGASSLALAALTQARALNSRSMPADTLTGLGKFIQYMQQPTGAFFDRFVCGSGPTMYQRSVQYPGEAIFALVSLYRVTQDVQWLVTAERGLYYLLSTGTLAGRWGILATQAFLACHAASRATVTSDALTKRTIRIAAMTLADKAVLTAGKPAPIAGKIETLAAALPMIPVASQRKLVTSIRAFIESGIATLAAAQITTGPQAGAFTGSTAATATLQESRQIRIDYVQRALAAFLAYQTLPPP